MEKIILWGTGKIANDVMEQFGLNAIETYEILGFIDNDCRKQGQYFYNLPIYSPQILNSLDCDKIVILTDYFDVISKQIRENFSYEENQIKNKYFFCERAILARYQSSCDEEIKEVISNITETGLTIFNYDYVNKYQHQEVCVEYDSECGMYFVVHNGKKMYFKKSFNSEPMVRDYYRNLISEQDKESPHRYLDGSFKVEVGDVVVDAGVAEGNFALDIVDASSKLYLIETDNEWIEALKKTFQPYNHKIVFIHKYLTSYDDGIYATLDSLIKEPINFLKMDIEGNEWDALKGSRKLIEKSKRLRCAVCSYHTDYDEILIKEELIRQKLSCHVTNGYMWFPYLTQNRYISTTLHRGIVRGERGY